MITANPSGTGENGRDFLAWLGGAGDLADVGVPVGVPFEVHQDPPHLCGRGGDLDVVLDDGNRLGGAREGADVDQEAEGEQDDHSQSCADPGHDGSHGVQPSRRLGCCPAGALALGGSGS